MGIRSQQSTWHAIVIVLWMGTIYSHGQSAQANDKSLPYPTVEGTPGQRDAAALKEIEESAAASIPESWLGIQGSGTATTGHSTREVPATLDIARNNQLRLDCDSMEGRSSLRVNAGVGVLSKEDGSRRPLERSPIAGPFPMIFDLWKLAQLTSVSAIDDGTVQAAGRALHKITLVYPDPSSWDASGRQATNLYFDPATHSLIHVVRADRPNTRTAHMLVHVSTYGDYRIVENARIPFAFTEMEDGHQGFRFTASNVTPEPSRDDSYFRF